MPLMVLVRSVVVAASANLRASLEVLAKMMVHFHPIFDGSVFRMKLHFRPILCVGDGDCQSMQKRTLRMKVHEREPLQSDAFFVYRIPMIPLGVESSPWLAR